MSELNGKTSYVSKKEYGKKLKEAAKEIGMPIPKLAEILGINPERIYKWTSGQNAPHETFRVEMAKHLPAMRNVDIVSAQVNLSFDVTPVSNPAHLTFGQYFKACREAQKLTVEQTAKLMGLKSGVISRIERDESRANLAKICKVFPAMQQASPYVPMSERKKIFGAKLLECLERSNMTPLKFAEKISADVHSVRAWIRGEHAPYKKNRSPILKVFPELGSVPPHRKNFSEDRTDVSSSDDSESNSTYLPNYVAVKKEKEAVISTDDAKELIDKNEFLPKMPPMSIANYLRLGREVGKILDTVDPHAVLATLNVFKEVMKIDPSLSLHEVVSVFYKMMK